MKKILLAIIGITTGFMIGFLTEPTPQYYQDTKVIVPENDRHFMEVTPLYSVSAYNVGDVSQNDDNPCLGAWGDDLCNILSQGGTVCANNYYPWGTKLYVEGYGTCVVMDKMNSRYGKYYIDIAFPSDQKQQALNWGRRDIIIKTNN